jgi:hypothetical protein
VILDTFPSMTEQPAGEIDEALRDPDQRVLDAQWDSEPKAIEARILRPLLWFGLLEYRHGADRYGGRDSGLGRFLSYRTKDMLSQANLLLLEAKPRHSY